MEVSSVTESYLDLFSFLVSAGASNVQGALGFLEAVADMLNSNSSSLNSAEQLWKMWNIIAQTLQDTIIASNEVNQGDALEYNFGCMHAVLLLPLNQDLASRLSQVLFKAMIKSWKELYHSFARLSALVPTADANACLEETCSKILQMKKVEFKEPSNLECLTSLALKMLDCVDFSAFTTNQGPGAILTLSPSKWARRRQRPMGNLHSFMHFLEFLQSTMNNLIFNDEEQEKQKSNPTALISVAHLLLDMYTILFAHINTPTLILQSMCIVAEPLSSFYRSNSPCNIQRLFVPSFFAKLEKLWHEIALCIGSRYNESYNSELLAAISPLLEATFLHSRRAIKNQAVALWNTTFSRAQTLEYPVALKPVLLRVKEKISIVLPGWINAEDIAIIAESPFSEMSMGMDSQVIAPPVLNPMLSPKRPRASMLNRDVSPVAGRNVSPPPATSSPAKVFTPKQARKLFAPAASSHNIVDMMPDEEFVVINSPVTRKKRLLTEHQKEVLKEKSVLPAMYNNLDASQDVSMMSQFGTETQNENSVTPDVIIINSSNSQDLEKKGSTSAMPPPKSMEKPLPVRISKRLSERSQSKEMDQNETDNLDQSSDPSEAETTKISSAATASGKGSTEQDNNGSAVPKEIEPSSAVEIEEESPFVMFRQNASYSPPLSASQGSQTREKDLSKSRVSLRKVLSEDSMSNFDKKKKTQKEREPRRVSLRKLDSPAKNDGKTSKDCKVAISKIDNGNILSSAKKTLLGEEKSQMAQTELESSAKSQENENSVSNILSSWSGQLKKSVLNKRSEKSPEPEVTAETEPSITLVEDTQSPDNLKKQKCKPTSESITETPTKNEDSSSPHLRSSSARKLFYDEPKQNLDEPTATPRSQKGVRQQLKSAESTSNIEDMPSSQGFQTSPELSREQVKTHDHHTMFGFSELGSQESEGPSAVSVGDSIQEPSIVSSKTGDNASHSMEESENFMPLLMPTMASSTQTQPSLSSSKSSETSSKTETSASETSSSKASSSPDFFPAQSTFQEDSLKDVVNKRKRGTPKKFSPKENERRTRNLKNVKTSPDGMKNQAIQKSREKLPNCSHEFGEITPDMKSPTSSTPPRGHSSTKRKRKLSKESTENSKARKSISPEVDKEAIAISNVPQEKPSPFQQAKIGAREERRKVLGSHLTRSSKKHLLRTRHKTSPPNKFRKLNSGRQVKTSGERSEQNVSDSDSDDNTPLVNLKKPSTVSTIQGDTTANSREDDQNNENDLAALENDELPTSDLNTTHGNKDNGVREALIDVSSNTRSAESTPTKSDKALNYAVVDEALNSVLSEMVKEISTHQNRSDESRAQALNEGTPLLLSEDVDMDINRQPEESQDHLQAGQTRHSLEADSELAAESVSLE
ncbi:hypothetical protein EGW08_014289, partial [Elysia chlorotica]